MSASLARSKKPESEKSASSVAQKGCLVTAVKTGSVINYARNRLGKEDPILQLDEAIDVVSSVVPFETSYTDNADAEICKNIMAAATANQEIQSDFQFANGAQNTPSSWVPRRY
eukprot:IDg14675t1